MAVITFDQIATAGNVSNSKISYFSLKNDGDEAIVRIMHDSTDTFDIVTTHPIQVGNKYKRVNCIRNPKESIDRCPLCSSGAKIQQKIYIHLIQYVNDENGNCVAQGKVWERAANFAVTLKNLIDEYGPLSNSIFKIRRNGEAGNMKTTYSILYCNPNVYNNADFPIDREMFNGYTAIGNAVLDQSPDELCYFISNGDFPSSNSNQNNTINVSNNTENVGVQLNTVEAVPRRGVTIALDNNGGNNGGVVFNQRPTRYY